MGLCSARCMHGGGELSDGEMEDVVAYIRLLSQR